MAVVLDEFKRRILPAIHVDEEDSAVRLIGVLHNFAVEGQDAPLADVQYHLVKRRCKVLGGGGEREGEGGEKGREET
jgi:hypothetical protein